MSSRNSKTPNKSDGTRKFMMAWLNSRKSGASSTASRNETRKEPPPASFDSMSPVSASRGRGSSVNSTPNESYSRPYTNRHRASAPRNDDRIRMELDMDERKLLGRSQDEIKNTEAECSQPRRLAFDDDRTPTQSRKRPLSQDDCPLTNLSSTRSKKTRTARRVIEISDSEDDEPSSKDKSYSPTAEELNEEEEEKEDVHKSQMSRDDGDVDMQVTNSSETGEVFDLSSLNFNSRSDKDNGATSKNQEVALPAHLEKQRSRARKKLSDVDMDANHRGPSEEDWYSSRSWALDIQDKNRRRPGDEGYDKTTLYIPPGAFRPGKGGLTPFQQQYWKIKKENYDVILFMKKGKFYEIFDVDADLCHKLLGLTWTRQGRGDMRFVGVPEIRFEKFASRLIELGYKVGRIEQTETGNGHQERKAQQVRKAGPSVCQRSLVKILTKATVNEDGLLKSHEARYVLSILESGYEEIEAVESTDPTHTVKVAVCYVDSASGNVVIRQFEDDFRRTETERLLTSLRPIEIIINKNGLSGRVTKLIRWSATRTNADIIENLSDAFVSISTTTISKYLNPDASKNQFDHLTAYLSENKLGSQCFNAMRMYLASLKIDEEILSLGNYTLSPLPEVSVGTVMDVDEPAPSLVASHSFDKQKATVAMDAATLNCLELVANIVDSSVKGSLLSFLNHAFTPAGMRLLRNWTTAPLVCTEDINCRLDAVESFVCLENEIGNHDFSSFSRKLKSGCDLERALPRLHKQATVQDSAVMYNDVNVGRVKTFFKVLRTIESTIATVAELRDALSENGYSSSRLKWLVSEGGAIPSETKQKLSYFFSDAFDTSRAESEGIIIPLEGSCPAYFKAKSDVKDIEKEFDEVLKKWQKRANDRSIKYFNRGKEVYQLEIPRPTLSKIDDRDLDLISQTKKVRRFYTEEIRELIRQINLAKEAFDVAKKNVMREIVQQFDQDYEIWSAVSKTSAELDALMGLARASLGDGSGPMCRPKVLPNEHPYPVFDATELRHPVLAASSPNFVANDVKLGGSEDPFIAVLTGSNASGKSTISRSVGVVSLLAQVGCYVPAQSLTLRPFKDVFVRMGASDDIARGLSTFVVEMEDVSHFLNDATSHSLVIADEVGRGTSTHDGYAIAYATLAHLAKANQCMSIFSTHYHTIGRDVTAECSESESKRVGVYEMASVEDRERKTVTFLYKLQKGISKGSHGISCARLAGIPAVVCDAAETAAEEFERALTAKLNTNALKALLDAGNNNEAILRVLDSM